MSNRIVVAAALAIGLMAVLSDSAAAQGPGGGGMRAGGAAAGCRAVE